MKLLPVKILSTGLLLCSCFFYQTSFAKDKEDLMEMLDSDSLGIVASGANPELVSSQFAFTEGPIADKKGNVYFTDQPNNKIWKYATDGTLSVFMDNAGRPNGQYMDSKGNLITCTEEKNQIWCISPKGKVKVLVTDFGGLNLNGPNDVWVKGKDHIYFTDPYYQRDFWTRKKPDLEGEKVYYLAPGKKQPVVVISDFKKPNGIIGTPDGKTLYVSDIGANETYVYDIAEDGMLTNKRLFAKQGSDGMTMDNQGNIYMTGRGVTVFNKDGKKVLNIPIASPWTSNVCFSGTNNDILFITSSKNIYTLKMNVQGAK